MSNPDISKLISFEVNNLMAIRFAEVEFDEAGGFVIIGGNNGSGKSSLLQAINFAFQGKKAIDKDPLRYGAEKGYVNVKLGGREFQIRRTINDKGAETLTVKGADGKPLKKAQAVLNELMGAVGIDPSIIWQMDDAKISETLRKAMNLNLEDLDAKEKDFFEQRAVANRKVKDSEGAFKGATFFEGVPEEKLSFKDLLNQLKEAETHNNQREKWVDEEEDVAERQKDIASDIAELERKLEEAKAEQIALIDRGKWLADQIEDFKEKDIDGIRSQMEEIEAINGKIDVNQNRARLEEQRNKDKAEAAALDAKVEAVRKEKRERIAAAEFPLEGVEFDLDGKLILDGKPWHAWSDGERLLAAFEISAAMSPDLKMVVMRQGSAFDNESKKVISDIAREQGYLVLMEVVGDSDEVHIYMNNGQAEDRRF